MAKPKKKQNNPVPGLMLYAKVPGLTSFSSLWSIKHSIGTEKVGHTGTLDSFAEGLLVVLSGPLTHLVPHITGFRKTYLAAVCFGIGTDTLDPGGRINGNGPAVEREALENVLPKFTGALLQVPPVYSAVHVDGKRASDSARDGNLVALEPRQVFIYSNRILDFRPADENDPCSYALLEISCSKGTYIRALARDIAEELGTVSHLSALRRTQVGPFKLEDAACYGRLKEFTIDNAIANDRFFADLRDNPPAPGTEKKRTRDSEETVREIRSHLQKFSPELAFTCGLKVDILKPECERAYLNGRPLHGGMFRRVPRPESMSECEWKCDRDVAVFYGDSSFAGMIELGEFRLSYGFVVPKRPAMKIFSWEQIAAGDFPAEWRETGCALSVGTFDGFHLGHKALVDSISESTGLVKGLVTFNKSYSSYSDPSGGNVYSLPQKISAAESMGLDFAVVIDFSPDFVRMDGQLFMSVLVEKCGMRFIAEGRDFRCGYKGSMDMDAIEKFAAEKNVVVKKLGDVLCGGERISSSRIKMAVQSGDFSLAREMLGKDFAYDCSTLVFEKKSAGVFAANVSGGGQILPKDGSYTVTLVWKDGTKADAICRIFFDGDGSRCLEFNLHDGMMDSMTQVPSVAWFR